jgi:hypothetical protein
VRCLFEPLNFTEGADCAEEIFIAILDDLNPDAPDLG